MTTSAAAAASAAAIASTSDEQLTEDRLVTTLAKFAADSGKKQPEPVATAAAAATTAGDDGKTDSSSSTSTSTNKERLLEKQLAAALAELEAERKRSGKFEALLWKCRDAAHACVERLPHTDCTSLDPPGPAENSPLTKPEASTEAADGGVSERPGLRLARMLQGELRWKLNRIPGVSATGWGRPRDRMDMPHCVILLDVKILPPWADDAPEQIERVKRAIPADVWKVARKDHIFVGPAGPPVIVRPL